MSICGAMIFVSLGIGGASLNIYTEVGLITLLGLISKHGILILQFANEIVNFTDNIHHHPVSRSKQYLSSYPQNLSYDT